MVTFEIRNNAEKGRLLGYLFYYELSKRFFAEILDEIDEWSAPFIFSGNVKRGIRSIDSFWSGKFVEQRIIPRDRQNLGTILRDNGLKAYDEFKLLQLSEGRCAQDEIYLVRIPEDEIVSEIKKRFEKKVLDVLPLKDFRNIVFFKNGESRIVYIRQLCEDDRSFGKILSDEELFKNVRVSPGGNGIEWGEERFISAEKLLKNGEATDISYDDVLAFIQTRVIDSADVSRSLNCSRQYVNQLVEKQRLIPVREGGKAKMYMKSSIELE